jgi:hypothetical protein
MSRANYRFAGPDPYLIFTVVKLMTTLHDVLDGTTNVFLAGEKHVPINRFGEFQNNQVNDCSAYNDDRNWPNIRKAGPGASLARSVVESVNLPPNTQFGSWHPGICQFVLCDGSVRAVSINISSTILGRLANMRDGAPVSSF